MSRILSITASVLVTLAACGREAERPAPPAEAAAQHRRRWPRRWAIGSRSTACRCTTRCRAAESR
jgi:hypothetical protein